MEPNRWIVSYLIDLHGELVAARAECEDRVSGLHHQINTTNSEITDLDSNIDDVLQALRQLRGE